MRKRNQFFILLIAPIALCMLLLGYLWYTHASIYWKLGDLPIYAPKDYNSYTIGAASSSPTSLTYVAIGDSVTAGVGVESYVNSYPYLVATEISHDTKSSVELLPFAIPGIRSEYVVGYFLEPVIASKPDIITLFIGINDIHGNVSIPKFKERYEKILSTLTEKTSADIYVVNLPYIGTEKLISLPYRYYFNWRTKQYNTVIKELASQHNVTYIDLYNAHSPHALDATYYAGDFFHPNTLGYTLWAKHIYASFNN